MAAKKRSAAKNDNTGMAAPHAVRRAPAPVPRPAPPAPPLIVDVNVTAPPARKRATKTALRALVPSIYRAEGETDPFLHSYKVKWLTKLDFTSDVNVHSLLMLAFLVLAVGRADEAERVVDQLISHVDLKKMKPETRTTIASALYLSAWLKSKRGETAIPYLARAQQLGRAGVFQDREWLSEQAEGEIHDAVARKKIDYLAFPLAGIVRWLNEPAARRRAEEILQVALAGARALMKPA
jgi:hypothetical protein